jgi:uncharacterized protein
VKFHLENAPGRNLFTGYGDGYVAVNQVRHESSLVVTVGQLYFYWPPHWHELTPAHFDFLLTLQPEIVLLGTGAAQKFPQPAHLQSLATARIGVEAMATPAACRTFNILAAEGRNVVAAIILQ